MFQLFHRFWRAVMLTLYPPKCYFCGSILDEDIPVCQECKENLMLTDETNWVQYGDQFSCCYSHCFYDERFKRGFHRYKFGGCCHYSKLFGAWMAARISESGEPPFEVMTWVPLHAFRKWKRGYDQAELLAREAASHLGMEPVKALRKVRNTAAQSTTASQKQRRKNVKDAYRPLTGEIVKGKRVLLIDDVITTGATLENAAAALRAGGASEVVCMTLARSLHGGAL